VIILIYHNLNYSHDPNILMISGINMMNENGEYKR